MRVLKKLVALLLIIVNICSLSGCWSYREIDQLGIAAGMAIDFDDVTSKYIVTIEMLHTEASSEIKGPTSKFYTSNADSIFDAARLLIIKTGKRIFWSHSVIIIVSEYVARTGMVPVLDWVNRDSEPRSDMNLIITKSCSAKQMLMTKSEPTEISSFHLNNIMKSQPLISKMVPATVWEFANGISNELLEPTAPVAEFDKTERKTEQIIYGTAIFKGDKAVGFINGDESFYLLMIKDKLKEGIIVIPKAAGTNTTTSLEVFHNKTTLTPIYTNGNITMKIRVKTLVAIDEVSGSDDLVVDEVSRNKLIKQTEEIVTQQLLSLIKKMEQDYNADVFGFLSTIKIKSPSIWRRLAKRKDEVFQNITPEINVEIIVKGSGTNSKPIKISNNILNGRVKNVPFNNCNICLNNIYRSPTLIQR
ncbi:MAG: Ger(x)C family spore germination protein [Clostridiaceae bacterium]|nr:Ger(x)C family spore germination protein [Clostridiaceae bacterium]